METATFALIVSSASLIVSIVTAGYNIGVIKERKTEARLADEALWNFRIIDNAKSYDRHTKGSAPLREAVITYKGSDLVNLTLLTPLFRCGGILLPAIEYAEASERPSGMIAGWKTFSGCLLAVDIVTREGEAKTSGSGREFWFFVEVPTRPAGNRDQSLTFEIMATFEEVVASRRKRQIRLKSDTTAWASETTMSSG